MYVSSIMQILLERDKLMVKPKVRENIAIYLIYSYMFNISKPRKVSLLKAKIENTVWQILSTNYNLLIKKTKTFAPLTLLHTVA